ncbi:hypothetical protein HPB48_009351 [Haemaphysalis longicornis]|uniref:Uncharacterized protein n=1 Tax=Haemaphysalis longicornis TaxID=44386 RepID=A0A9J6FDI0_HAELO|nr:hypothetical protein HPB48_009351 [Haemaphysalis longicornis]
MSRRRAADSANSADDERPTVKCDVCGRWDYLEETPFADLDEAGTENTPWQCRGCQRVAALEAQGAECIAALAQRARCEACEQLDGRIADIEAKIQELEVPLGPGGTPGRRKKASSPLGTGQARQETQADATPEELKEATPDSTCEELAQGSGYRDKVEEQHQSTSSGNQPGMTAAEGSSNHPDAQSTTGADDTTLKATQSEPPADAREREQGAGDDGVHQKNTPSSRTVAQPKRHKSPWLRPPPGVTKEVVVVGDANVGLLAKGLVSEVGAPQCIEAVYCKGATVAQSLKLVEEYERAARPVHRLWVLHVGLPDLLAAKGEEVLSRVEEWCEGRGRSVLICSIPEVTRRGGETRARVVMANGQLKKLCKRRRIRFLDLSANGSDDHFAADGVSYGSEGIRRVIKQLATPMARFLDVEAGTLSWNARRSTGRPETLSVADDLKMSQNGLHATSMGSRRPDCNLCAACQVGKAQRSCKQSEKHPNRKTPTQRPEPRKPTNGSTTKAQDPGHNLAPKNSVPTEARIKELIQEHLSRRWPTLGPAWGRRRRG